MGNLGGVLSGVCVAAALLWLTVGPDEPAVRQDLVTAAI
jgi:hypothetical protein